MAEDERSSKRRRPDLGGVQVKIDESKLKAFSEGRMNAVQKKTPFQLRKEEQERKKRQAEREAAAVFAEFAASFEEEESSKPMFVGAGGKGEYGGRKRGRSPPGKAAAKPAEIAKSSSAAAMFDDDEEEVVVQKVEKKSNMAAFVEELKRKQELRDSRKVPGMPSVPVPAVDLPDKSGSFDTGDPSTTNLFVGNLSFNMTEALMCQIFGAYGPLASVKIMWPRTTEEKSRGRMTGFVAFMDREDAAECLEEMNGQEILGHVARMGWGKAVPVPDQPFFAGTRDPKRKRKPAMFIRPPPARKIIALDPNVIYVNRPSDKAKRQLIHRMIEFVVLHGPKFEAEMVQRKAKDPQFTFLVNYNSPDHIYYRWKLFSVLQGERVDKWSTKPFTMLKGGRTWQPPDADGSVKGRLTTRELEKLERILHGLTTERKLIADAMVFCLRRAHAAEEVVGCIAESLSKLETPPRCKIARLFLVSDILHNCGANVPNASFYRTGFEAKLPEIFTHLRETYHAITGRLRAERFKTQVMSCLRFWTDNNMFTPDYFATLEKEFLQTPKPSKQPADAGAATAAKTTAAASTTVTPAASQPAAVGADDDEDEDVDGVPMDQDEDVDGVPMEEDEDVDGVPL